MWEILLNSISNGWLKWAILFLGISRQGQVVILRPAGLQIFPRRDALGLTIKWDLRNNKWGVIIKTG